MSSNAITRARAETLLSAYGANPMHWPADERDAMQAALLQWPELAELMAAEQALDTQLSASEVPSAVSVERLLANIDKLPARQPLLLPALTNMTHRSNGGELGRRWQWWHIAMAACAPLALGVGLGMSSVEISDDWQGSEQYLFAPGYEESIHG